MSSINMLFFKQVDLFSSVYIKESSDYSLLSFYFQKTKDLLLVPSICSAAGKLLRGLHYNHSLNYSVTCISSLKWVIRTQRKLVCSILFFIIEVIENKFVLFGVL